MDCFIDAASAGCFC